MQSAIDQFNISITRVRDLIAIYHKIADAIRLISDKKLWKEVASILGKTDQDIKQQLSLIVDRRNKIAHEADIDPSYNLGNRWPINESLVNDAVNFLEQLIRAIHQILN